MNRSIKSIPLGAVLAFALASVSAHTAAPMATASAPARVGVSPQEAATATQNAVPRSDTGTLVQTAPTAVDKARDVMNDTTTPRVAPTTSTRTAPMAGTRASPMTTIPGDSMPSEGAAMTKRKPRADRN